MRLFIIVSSILALAACAMPQGETQMRPARSQWELPGMMAVND